MISLHKILKASSVASLLADEALFLSSNSGFGTAFKRYFLSRPDQRKEFPEEEGPVSYIVQPPLDGSSVAVWLYLVKELEIEMIWSAGLVGRSSGCGAQTGEILERYESELAGKGLSIVDNCVRTWFYVSDIDNNYGAMVKARRENFDRVGLTSGTHYLASTGICGTPVTVGSLVQMDALAFKGDFSQRYLYARTHLNPTYEYGVTFERGVRIDFAGQKLVFISGTASIDNKGRVLHIGDVTAQTYRMWENVASLLSEAECSWNDVKMMLVYLRNAEDYAGVASLFAEKFPGIPCLIMHAPVCRPEWLIEMECLA